MIVPTVLPPGVIVLERGWLSANGILFQGNEGTALVDSGYSTHAGQTLALVRRELGNRTLDLLVNTHLHSDHCGGNSALQHEYTALRTLVPPGQADLVRQWDPVGLGYLPTGQVCPRFNVDGVVRPGEDIKLGDTAWQVHAAPGHDPHSVVLFEPETRTLISADALWQNGFGIVFPELDGESAFGEVARTLDLIESLEPAVAVPGHGHVFSGPRAVADALDVARSRLSGFVADPARHATHAAKVLIKFKLLEWQSVKLAELMMWASATGYFSLVADRYFPGVEFQSWITSLLDQLVRSRAAAREGDALVNI